MVIRFLVCVLLVGCGNKEPAPTPPPATETPAPGAAPPAAPAPTESPNPHPVAENFRSASVRPKALSGQVMRNDKLVDVTTLDPWVQTIGCDGLSTGGDVSVGDKFNKTVLNLHLRGEEYVKVGETYEFVADRGAPAFASAMFEAGLTNATSGKVKVNQLVGGVDVEVEADFGAKGKVSAHLVTGAPLSPCKK